MLLCLSTSNYLSLQILKQKILEKACIITKCWPSQLAALNKVVQFSPICSQPHVLNFNSIILTQQHIQMASDGEGTCIQQTDVNESLEKKTAGGEAYCTYILITFNILQFCKWTDCNSGHKFLSEEKENSYFRCVM